MREFRDARVIFPGDIGYQDAPVGVRLGLL